MHPHRPAWAFEATSPKRKTSREDAAGQCWSSRPAQSLAEAKRVAELVVGSRWIHTDDTSIPHQSVACAKEKEAYSAVSGVSHSQ